MKYIYVFAAMSFAASSMSASAADAVFGNDTSFMPAMTAPAVGYDWTGAYAGATAGALVKGDHLPGVKRFRDGAFVGGLHAGYNYQTQDNWVLGVEADGNWVNAGNDVVALKNYGSARVRVGHAVGRFLPYVDGGVVIGRMTGVSQGSRPVQLDGKTIGRRFAGLRSAVKSSQPTHVGYTLGAGLEYALTDRISTRISYHYIDLKKRDYVVDGRTQPVGYKGHTIAAGLSVRF